MKYLPLIWAGLWRKKIRTVLTLLSIVVAFALFGLMEGVTAGLDDAIEGLTDESRLMVQSRVNIIEPLPIAYVPRIQSVDGVDEIAYYGYFGGFFQEPRNQINTGAVNIDAFFDMYPEFIVPPEQLEAMMRTRNGALVGADLMERFGWSIGDRVPLGSTIWSTQAGTNTWEFEIVGVFTTDTGANQDDFYVHYDYFDEERTAGNGTVALYLVKVDDVALSDRISEEIDSLFLNSTNETQTMNEREFTRAQIAQIGDINFFRQCDRRRRHVHTAVPHRQHDDAIGPRAHSGAGRPQDIRLQRCVADGLHLRRISAVVPGRCADRSRHRGSGVPERVRCHGCAAAAFAAQRRGDRLRHRRGPGHRQCAATGIARAAPEHRRRACRTLGIRI